MDPGGPQQVINTSRAARGNKDKTLCRAYSLDFLLIHLFIVCVPPEMLNMHIGIKK